MLTSSPASPKQPSEPAGSSDGQTGLDYGMAEGQRYARSEQVFADENVRDVERSHYLCRRKRNKNKNHFSVKLGTGVQYSDLTFKAVENKVPILITNVHKETPENDIVKYILRKTQETVSLIKLSSKIEKRHNAYKLYVPSNKLHVFLDVSMWPKGIVFRRFINIHKLFRNEDLESSKILNKNGQDK